MDLLKLFSYFTVLTVLFYYFCFILLFHIHTIFFYNLLIQTNQFMPFLKRTTGKTIWFKIEITCHVNLEIYPYRRLIPISPKQLKYFLYFLKKLSVNLRFALVWFRFRMHEKLIQELVQETIKFPLNLPPWKILGNPVPFII